MLLSLYDGNIFKWEETPRINKQSPTPPKSICLFACLEFFVPLENFSLLFGDVTIADEKLQISTDARH